MIRTVSALFAFAVIVCALIVFRPFSGSDDTAVNDRLGTSAASDVGVTRAASEQSALSAVALAAAPTPAPPPAPAPVEAPRRVDVARPATDDTSLQAMTNNVLAELGFAGVEPTVTPSQQELESTANILAGIQAVTGQKAPVAERTTLEQLVVKALREGQSDTEIDTMVNAASVAGEVVVPEILVTSDGRVDTHVLLSNIITQAQVAAGAPAPAIPVINPNETAGLEVRVVQRATDEVEARFYTVQSGDSLGAISIKFFGSVEYFPQIYQANRGLLSSPDRIRVGQRLVIPQING